MAIEGQLNEAERRLITGAVKQHRFRQACQPAEIAASCLPSSVCSFALRLLPRRWAGQLSEGRD